MFRRRRTAEDFAAEIDAHVQLEYERLRDGGLEAEAARAAAHRAFGNIAQTRERFYESGTWLWWDRLKQDVRYSARVLRRSPGFTCVVVLTIALGVGATTAIFSVVDAVLLRPLPYPEAGRLVAIQDDLPGVGARDVGLSQPEWQDLQRSGIFEYVSPVWFDENNLTGGAQPARVMVDIVAPNYFTLLGIDPQMGHPFSPSDPTPGFTLEAVISDGLWRRVFGSDAHILDRSIRLDNDLYRIIGVMPAAFRAPGRTTDERDVEVWVATNFHGPPLLARPPRSGRNIPGAIGRLRAGLTVEAGQRKVDALVAALHREYPGDYPQESAWRVRLVPLKQTVVGGVERSLRLLVGAAVLVLLIAGVNVANLLVARAGARRREMAVRQAIGAGPTRLRRQLLTEATLLSLLGGAAAVAVLFGTRPFLPLLVPNSLPRLNEIAIGFRVLLVALAATLGTGVLAGLLPAWRLDRLDVARGLKPEPRGSTPSQARARARRILVVAEVAFSLVLLVAAGLLLRSFQDLLNVRLGFDPQDVVSVRTRLPYPNDISADRYFTVSQQAPFFRELLRRARRLPGVQEVALGSSAAIPLDHAQHDLNRVPVVFEGRAGQLDQPSLVDASMVTPEYFHLMRMTLLRGRPIGEHDVEETMHVAVINEAMARTYWPSEDPLGKHVRFTSTASAWVTIVGIVADARTESLADPGAPRIYASLYQYERGAKHLAIFLRGHMDRTTVLDRMRAQVQAIDPTLPVFGAQTLRETVSVSLAERRFSLEMVGSFAATALLLAALGIYGVIAHVVTERTHEIGIRLALGAQHWAILGEIAREFLVLTAAGTAIGLTGARLASHALMTVLYGVRPTDPLTFVGVTAVLVGVALLACYLPARHALRVSALVALRAE